jgi:hypothetical protein
MEGEYNGYTNKPTQLVSAWIHSKVTSYNHWLRLAGDLSEDSLAQELKQHYEQDRNPLINKDNILYKELLDYSLGVINWIEISKLLIKEARK